MAAIASPVCPLVRCQPHFTQLKLSAYVYGSLRPVATTSLAPASPSLHPKPVARKASSVRCSAAAAISRGEVVRGCFLSTLLQGGGSTQADAAARRAGAAQETVPVFYYYPLAFNPQKARMALEEKGLRYEIRIVDAIDGGNLTADYLRINPNATVPTLQTGPKDFITDSNDILKWIDTQGEPLGGALVNRALVDKWYKFVSDEWDANLYAFTAVPGPGKFVSDFKVKVARAQQRRYPELAELYQKRIDMFSKYGREMGDEGVKRGLEAKLAAALDDAEAQLKSSQFVAGDAFSMADVILVTVLARVDNLGRQEAYSKRPAVVRYFDEAKKRNSYKVAIGDFFGPGALPYILPTLGSLASRTLFHNYSY